MTCENCGSAHFLESEGPTCATCGRRPLGWRLARVPFKQLWEERTGRPMPQIIKPKINSLQDLLNGEGRSDYIVNRQKDSLERHSIALKYLERQCELFGFSWEQYFEPVELPRKCWEKTQVILDIYIILLTKIIKEKKLWRKELVKEIDGMTTRPFQRFLNQSRGKPIAPTRELITWTERNWGISPALIEKKSYGRKFSWLDKEDLIQVLEKETGVLVKTHTIDRYLVAIKTELGLDFKKWEKRGGRVYFKTKGKRAYA